MKKSRKLSNLRKKQKRSIWRIRKRYIDKAYFLKTLYTPYCDRDTISKIEKLYGCYDHFLPNLNSPFQKYIEEECKKYRKTRSNYNGN